MSEEKKKKKRLLIIIFGIVAVIAIATTGIAVSANRRKAGEKNQYVQESLITDDKASSNNYSYSELSAEDEESSKDVIKAEESSEGGKANSSDSKSEENESDGTDSKTEDSKQDEDSKKSEDSNKEDSQKDEAKKDDSSKEDSSKNEESSKPDEKNDDSKQSEEAKPHEHTWVKGETVVPTCEENGYTEYNCSGCGEGEKRDIIEATGHDYELRDIVEASCRSEGYYYFICKICHKQYKANITPQLDHQFDEGKVTKEATCAEEGEITYTCELCGETKTEKIEKLAHTRGEVVIENEVAAICEKEGSYDKVIYCTVCEVELSRETVTTEALGHNFEFSETVAPTCTEDGYDVYVCSVCGEAQKRNFVDALGHDYIERIKKEATCAEEGVLMHICSVCGNNYTEPIEKLPHTPGEAVMENVISATCEEEGSYDEVVYCTVCGEELSRETKATEATGHSYELRDIIEATCQHEGYYALVCSKCHDQYKTNITPQLDHEYGEGVVTKEATCSEPGIMTYTCVMCGETKEEEIPVIPHTPDEPVEVIITEPTCTESGTAVLETRCAVCDELITSEEIKIAPLGHKFGDVIVVVPTCIEKGYSYHVCEVCGLEEVIDGSETDTIDHTWVFNSTVAPSCDKEGYDVYVCSVCGETENRNITPALGHDYVATVTKEPTCAEEGERRYICSRCGDSYAEAIPMTEHTPGDAVTENEIPARCEEDGSYDEVVYCDVCGEELSRETKTTEATGHSYQLRDIVEANCQHEGWYMLVCSHCGDQYKANVTPMTDHQYDEGVITKAATCSETGIKTYTCVMCGETYTEIIPVVEHTPDDKVMENVIPAACEKAGSYEEVVYCHVCGEELSRETKITEATGHSYELRDIIEATCQHDGYYALVCTKCHAQYRANVTPQLDHGYVVSSQTLPTCEEDGFITYQCSMCGDEYKEITDKALGHDWVSTGVFDGDCQNSGYELFVCNNCGEEKKVENGIFGDHTYKATIIYPTETEGGYTLHKCTICEDEYKDTFTDAVGEYYYSFEVLNQHTLITTSNIIVHMITNDHEINSFSSYRDEYLTVLGRNVYQDITYVCDEDGYIINNGGFFKVSDGYVYPVAYYSPGQHTLTISKNGQTIEKLTFTVVDESAMEVSFIDTVFNSLYDPGLTDKENMDNFEQWVLQNFHYNRNDGTYLTALAQDIGSYTETRFIDCIGCSRLMIKFGEKLGATGEYTYAGYLNHHYATITFSDGSTAIYDLPLFSSTGVIPYSMLIE